MSCQPRRITSKIVLAFQCPANHVGLPHSKFFNATSKLKEPKIASKMLADSSGHNTVNCHQVKTVNASHYLHFSFWKDYPLLRNFKRFFEVSLKKSAQSMKVLFSNQSMKVLLFSNQSVKEPFFSNQPMKVPFFSSHFFQISHWKCHFFQIRLWKCYFFSVSLWNC